jgi:hypothetical protein
MGLQLGTGGHIGVLCVHYRNYTIIKLLGIPLIFFHVCPANLPTTMIVALCHKKFGHPWISRSKTGVNLTICHLATTLSYPRGNVIQLFKH